MDNVTHTLTGLALSRAGLNRLIPKAALLMILSANIPDIDIVFLSSGHLRYLEMHRGYSHSLIGLPLMAIIPVLLWAGIAYRDMSGWRSWIWAWAISCVGVISHLLLDWTNSYGVRPFIPFSSAWYYLDLNSLWDGVILAILFSAAVWPLLVGLVNAEIGARKQSGRAIAVLALVLFVAYDSAKAVLHSQAVAQLQSREYGGALPLAAAALPGAWDPLVWTGVVETSEAFKTYEVRSFGDLNVNTAETFYKLPESAATVTAARTEPFRYFRYFARFPIWSVDSIYEQSRPSTLVQLFDLRFSRSARTGFRAEAVVQPNGQVTHSWFSFGK